MTPAWQCFKRSIQRIWRVLILACITQQALVKAERIHTCVQHRCDLMKSNQGQMICNLLGWQWGAVTLDKVSRLTAGGIGTVIDNPADVLSEVHNHFKQWTSKRQVQLLSRFWAEVY